MSTYTNFPGTNSFYGGITSTWGTGLHQDKDPVTGEEECILASYLNRVELRIQRLEYYVNQLEHELLYPSGRVATSGYTDSVPASGEYYLGSRMDRMASGVNRVVQLLEDAGTIVGGAVSYYPFHVGTI